MGELTSCVFNIHHDTYACYRFFLVLNNTHAAIPGTTRNIISTVAVHRIGGLGKINIGFCSFCEVFVSRREAMRNAVILWVFFLTEWGMACLYQICCSQLWWLSKMCIWGSGGHRYDHHWILQHSFVEIDHGIFSVVILSLSLIQERHLSVSGELMCTSTG